ncbi:MAG: response regulator, partial [Chloroflexota bacterium]
MATDLRNEEYEGRTDLAGYGRLPTISERDVRDTYDVLFSRLPHGLAILEGPDEAGQLGAARFRQVNGAFEQVTGIDSATLVGKQIDEVMLPEDHKSFVRRIAGLPVTSASAGQAICLQLGSRWYEAAYLPLEPRLTAISLRDITEQRRLQTVAYKLAGLTSRINAQSDTPSLLAMLCEQSALLLEQPAAAIFLVDHHQDVLYLAAGAGLPSTIHSQHPSIPRELYERHVRRAGPTFVLPDGLGLTDVLSKHVCIEGRACSIGIASMLHGGELVGMLTVVALGERREFGDAEMNLLQGIADQAALAIQHALQHEELLERGRQVGRLLKAVVGVQEEERQRIHRNLQEGVASPLALAIKILDDLRASEGVPAETSKHIQGLTELVADTLSQASRAVNNLQPPRLDTLGLAESMQADLREEEIATGLRSDFQADYVNLPPAVETALYRIFREALNNVRQHAEAKMVIVRLRAEHGQVSLEVQDDGIGFDQATLDRRCYPKGAGLQSISKNAELIQGRLVIDSRPNEGTLLRVEAPLLVIQGGARRRDGADGPEQQSSAQPTGQREDQPSVAVLIADSQPITREGLRSVLSDTTETRVVGEAAEGGEVLRLVDELRPRVLLLDMGLPGYTPTELIRQMKAKYPETAIIALNNREDDDLAIATLLAGSAGYLLKDTSPQLLRHTIRAAVTGGSVVSAVLLRRLLENLAGKAKAAGEPAEKTRTIETLSPREREVLSLLAEGRTNKEIADRLYL